MGGKNTGPSSTLDAFRLLGEKLLHQSKTPNVYGYDPMDKQKLFHSSQKKTRLYIGGNRSGKTTGGVIEDLFWAMGEHPYFNKFESPVRGRVVGVDFLNGIQKIILPEVQRWVPVSKLRGASWATAYDKQERVLHFANESFIEFMSYDQDLDKFAGTSRHFIHYDEEPPQDIYRECQARLVDTGGHSWLTMTPIDGMTWVYDTLYLPGLEDAKNIDVVQVGMEENVHLSEVEVEAFLDSLDEEERKIRGKGEFIQLGGLIYKAFGKDTHVVPFPETGIPKDWLWAVSLDHGFNNPTAALWHAVSPEGKILTFHEHYQSGMTIDDHARKIHSINREFSRQPDFYIGDPSIRNTDPITGTSIHEEYIKYDIPIVLGNNDVKAGIVKVARYLKCGKDGKPNYMVTANCTNTIREFSRYRWKTFANKRLNDNNNPQEQPVKKDDHALDSLRYFIMSRPDLTPDLPGGSTPQTNPFNLPVAYGEGLTVGKHINTPYDNSEPVFRNPEYNTEWELQDDNLGSIF